MVEHTSIRMNDGVHLDATVLTPDGPAPADGWPSILLVHGHGDDGSKAMCLDRRGYRYAEAGYLVCAYSVRGQGASEGLSFHLGARELFDLQDVIDWFFDQHPVRRLAVVGSSQGGWHAWMAAAHHPRVTTAVPMNIFTNYADFAVENGCLTRWFFTRTMRRRVCTAGLQELAVDWALQGEWERLRTWLRPMSPALFADRVRCPVLIVHGWHDAGMPAGDVLRLFDRLRVPKRLYLGGGGHEGRDHADAEQVRITLEARWLAHWLKGEANGVMEDPPVVFARRPGWEHGHAVQIPTPGPTGATLFLRLDGTLRPESTDRVVTHRNVHNVIVDPGYGLQQALLRDLDGVDAAVRHEPQIFDGQPLAAPMWILGEPTATLHVLCNRPNYQVHAALFDVSADGTARRITRGHVGTRSATPGQHHRVEVVLRAISYEVPAGHHLRLVVGNMDPEVVFPFFERFTLRLYVDHERSSCVRLPCHPAGA